MKIFEVNKRYIKELGSIEKAIQEGYCINWDKEKIKAAFNYGDGTIKDFKNYMDNNKKICVFKKIR